MQHPELEAEELTEVASQARPATFLFSSNPKWYLACLLILILAMFVLPLYIVRTNIYTHLSTAFLDAKVDYPYSISSRQYDVVIYGDSSALFGIDPLIVSKRLGLSVINLSQTGGVLRVEGERPLDAYLRANGKPKLLVLALNPENVSIDQDSPEILAIDGWYSMFRRRSLMESFRMFARYPRMLFELWHNSVYQEFLSGGILRNVYKNKWNEINAHNGFYHYYLISQSLPSCASIPVQDAAKMRQQTYLNYFRSKYSRLGIDTAVFFTPIADCSPNLPMFQQVLSTSAINKPFALPRADIADDYQACHLLPPGVLRSSEVFSDAIGQLLARSSSAR